MAVKNQSDLLTSLRAVLGNNNSDEAIALIEDITDTTNDYETRTKDSTNWKQKFVENDANWRKKYTDRFYDGDDNTPPPPADDSNKPKPLTYDNLFKEG